MRLKSTRVSFCIAAKLCAYFLLVSKVVLGPWSMRSRRTWINHRPRTGSTVRKRPKARMPSTSGELSAWSAAMNLVIGAILGGTLQPAWYCI